MKILIYICSLLAVIFFLLFSKDGDLPVPKPEETRSNKTIRVQKSVEEKQRELAINEAAQEIEKDSKEPVVTPDAAELYQQARATALEGNFSATTEALHDAYSKSPDLIDQTLKDQAFRKYRTEDNFRKLLNIHGRDTFRDLGLGPIVLPK